MKSGAVVAGLAKGAIITAAWALLATMFGFAPATIIIGVICALAMAL